MINVYGEILSLVDRLCNELFDSSSDKYFNALFNVFILIIVYVLELILIFYFYNCDLHG